MHGGVVALAGLGGDVTQRHLETTQRDEPLGSVEQRAARVVCGHVASLSAWTTA